jgi:hypothetical protein
MSAVVREWRDYKLTLSEVPNIVRAIALPYLLADCPV